MFNLSLSRRCFRGGWMGLRVSSGPGVTIRLDLGMWLVNTGSVSSSGENTLIPDFVKVERGEQVDKCRVMMKGLWRSRWNNTDVGAQFQAWKTSSCCLWGRRMSCGSTWRTGREGRRRPSTPPSQSIARMPGISFTWAASPAEQQVRIAEWTLLWSNLSLNVKANEWLYWMLFKLKRFLYAFWVFTIQDCYLIMGQRVNLNGFLNSLYSHLSFVVSLQSWM